MANQTIVDLGERAFREREIIFQVSAWISIAREVSLDSTRLAIVLPYRKLW
jgi:hypothetical protein